MSYTHTTWGELKAALADRLADPGMVFWTATELDVYLTEALRAWGLATNYWRERTTFNTVASQAFYATETVLSSLLGFTVTDRNLVQAIQFSLLESAAAQDNTWAPTEMYTLAQVAGSLNDMRDRFLTETGLVLTRSTQAMPAPPIGRVAINDHIIDVRRVAWQQASDSSYHLLWREDEWSEAAINALYESSPTTPYAYTVTGAKPVELLVAPPPSVPGTLELITVNAGALLHPADAATALGIPDNCAPAIKWAVLSDLLSGDGQESDPIRHHFADRRWAEFLELSKLSTSIVNILISGSVVFSGALFDFDAALGNWQNTTGAPTDVALAGLNMLAFSPMPNGVYGITVDVSRNAPIPANDAAFVQVGLEELTILVDYAEACAMFKVGGNELATTAEVRMKSFYDAAAEYNDKLRANALFARTIFHQTEREQAERPRRLEAADAR